MIRFAVCDDEPEMARQLAELLAECMAEHPDRACTVERFGNGRALLEAEGGFDAIFLDIQMKSPDGMETARLLRQRGERGLVVFVTVLRELVFDAFQVEAFDYLLKPLDPERFRQTVDRVLRALERRREDSLVIQRGNGCQVVPLSDILYGEVLGRKIYLHRRDGTVVDYYERLEDLERRVDGRFFRCHRSYLVNLDYVRGCQAGRVLLAQGESLPASRLREEALTQALLRHMSKRGR